MNLSDEKLDELQKNPQEIMQYASNLINQAKRANLLHHLLVRICMQAHIRRGYVVPSNLIREAAEQTRSLIVDDEEDGR